MRRSLILIALAGTAAAAAAARPRPTRTVVRRRRGVGAEAAADVPINTYLHAGYTRTPGADPADDTSIIAWTPPSPWYEEKAEAGVITSTFPTCQHPEWCDTPYNDTLAVQTAIHAAQNPASCDTARILVITEEWPSGLGSTLAIHAYTLALALSDNRVIVRAPSQGWPFAPPSMCGCDRVGKPCVPGGEPSTVVSSLDCLFVPVSRCGLPADWENAPQWRLGAPDRVMQAQSVSELQSISQCEATVQSRSPALARYSKRPPSWWHAQLVSYVARPRPSTLTHIVAPAMQNAFWATGGIPPRPLAAVFMRGGDKGSEAALQPVTSYFDAMKPVATALNVTNIYVSSDDGTMIEAAVDRYDGLSYVGAYAAAVAQDAKWAELGFYIPPRPPLDTTKLPPYALHFIDWARAPGGTTFDDLMSWSGTWRMEHVVRLAVADMYITAGADVVVGTLSSNWCRTADALRRAAGRGRVPYATPEKALYYSVCPNVEDDAPDHGKHMADWPATTAALRAATDASWVGRG